MVPPSYQNFQKDYSAESFQVTKIQTLPDIAPQLKFVGNNWLVTVTSGAIVLPFNYAVGERLGAVTFAENYFLTVFIVGIIWSACLPLLFATTDESFKKKFTA